MATPTLARSPLRNRFRNTIWSIAALFVVLVLSGLSAALWFRHAAMASLPKLDGTIQVAGLSAPVTAVRDEHGVPHISASTMRDLLFAQGYVTAQDRLWQMDINRRFGRGELSEVFGKRTLKIDKRQRTLQLKQAVERAIALLSPEDRADMEAYANGVNALIGAQKDKLPIEFRVMGYQPRPWTIADSLMIGVNIAQSLSTQYDVEYAREKLSRHAALTPEMLSDLYPIGSWRDRPPSALPRSEQISSPPSVEPSPEEDESETLNILRKTLPDLCDSCYPGSNNWVISGVHTASGKPLLSNDMHLDHSIPGVWYEVHLKSGAFDVAGVSFPGLPFVVAGHNQRIAWGFTNLGPDVQDLFIENFNAAGEYQTPQGWLKPERAREIIKVKGQADVTLETTVTRHGPLISDLFPGETRQLSLQWTIYDPKTLSLAFNLIDAAQDWEQFRKALSHFGGATQNVVYADVDGHIGYQAAGWIPIRAGGDGLTLQPGNEDSHAWTGYVPFEKLPSVYDPASGMIATANAKVTNDGYPYLLANEWGSPYRTERIYRVLESGKKFSAADMLALQMDTYSEFDRLTANSFVYAIDHAKHASERTHKAADLMRGWDGRVEVNSVAPTIAVSARKKLWKMLLEPKVGSDWEEYRWFSSSVAMEKLLRTKPQRWLPNGYANWDDLLAVAMEAALTDSDSPRDLSTWKWGNSFPVAIQHPIFGALPMLNRYSGPGEHPQPGNGSLTVKAAGRGFGASERATYDLSNLDASTLNIVVGQSGQIFSQHYMDQWHAWYSGNTFALPFTENAVKQNASHSLTLRP